MKPFLMGQVLPFPLVFTMCFVLMSCSESEVKPDRTAGLIKIQEGYALGASINVQLWAKQNLFAGYNEVFFLLIDSASGAPITESQISIHPVMDMGTMTHSCPVEDPDSNAVDGLFRAGIMFTMPTNNMGNWTLDLNIHNHQNGLTGHALFDITVQETTPEKVIPFLAHDGKRYYLSYHFPGKIKVGVNELEIIVFTAQSGTFVPAENLTFRLIPEMPSMEHGSPNNVDPVHVLSGHYSGKANFTMTGEWRLHLDIADGQTHLAAKYFDVVVQ